MTIYCTKPQINQNRTACLHLYVHIQFVIPPQTPPLFPSFGTTSFKKAVLNRPEWLCCSKVKICFVQVFPSSITVHHELIISFSFICLFLLFFYTHFCITPSQSITVGPSSEYSISSHLCMNICLFVCVR